MKKSILFTMVIQLILANALLAQKETVNGNQQWLQYYTTLKLSDKFGLYSDFGMRWKDGFSEASQTLARTGLGYNVKKNVRVLAGFAFLTFLREGEFERFEYRPYQEVAVSQLFGKVRAQHRLRVEERILRSVGDDERIRDSFNYRFRYRFYAFIPVGTLADKYPMFINAGDEILVNAGGDIARNIFDSNRLLIGPAIQLKSNLNISLTYNYIFAKRNQGEVTSNAHIVWLGVKHKIDLVD